MKKLAIILVNYKDYVNKFLPECKESLDKQNYPVDLFKTYIVDNASSEQSRNYIQQNYPEAKIVPRGNGNYSAANNAGIKKAIADGFEYFVIANMDTKFDKNWLKELVLAWESKPDAGIIQSKIFLYPKNKNEELNLKINSLGNKFHYLGFGYTDGYNIPNSEIKITEIKEIKGYASGCSFILSKTIFEKVGGYDEELYMYHDDVDLGLACKVAGYKIYLASKSIVYHKYEFSRSVRMLYYMERNRFIVMFSYYKLATLIAILPMIVIMELGMFFYALLKGWVGTKLRVTWYFCQIKTWKYILDKRKKIKKFRKIKDKEFIKDFSGKIEFQEINNPVLQYLANPVLNVYLKVIKKVIFW